MFFTKYFVLLAKQSGYHEPLAKMFRAKESFISS